MNDIVIVVLFFVCGCVDLLFFFLICVLHTKQSDGIESQMYKLHQVLYHSTWIVNMLWCIIGYVWLWALAHIDQIKPLCSFSADSFQEHDISSQMVHEEGTFCPYVHIYWW